MLYTNIYDVNEWKDEAISMKAQGFATRHICRSLFSNENYRNRLNAFFKREDIADEIYHQACQIELNKQIEKGVSGNDYTDWEKKEKPNLVPIVKTPRTLIWDLESSLLEGYFFRIWQENIPMRRIKKQAHLLSASFAFNDGQVQGYRLTPEQVKTGDDFDVVCKVVEAVNNCDLMVTFNGKRFDVKLLNTRALFWGLPPVKAPKHIDLFEQSKRVFKFPSNSMQNVSMYLGENGKLETSGSNLWERCAEWENYEECEKALIEMVTYGNQDIEATRDLYKRFQGWMKGVPNLGVITNEVTENKTLRCIHCGSDNVFPLDQKTYTSVSSFDLYRCGNESCRGISRATSNGKNLTSVI
jgi:DNA polymerase elongation subunit (family B)